MGVLREKVCCKAITWYRNYWLRSATTISAMVDFWSSLSQDWDLDKSPLFGLSLTFILLLKREVEETSYIVAFLTRKAKRTIKHSTWICKMLFPFGCILLQKRRENSSSKGSCSFAINAFIGQTHTLFTAKGSSNLNLLQLQNLKSSICI